MDSESEDDLILLAESIEAENKDKRVRSCWVHAINQRREELGEYHRLIQELRNHPDRFFGYFRMSVDQFDRLVETLRSQLEGDQSYYRSPISVGEKVAVTLRYLATGDAIKTISTSFRLGFETTRQAIFQTCDALWDILQPSLLPQPDEQLWREKEKRFANRWNFPHVVGAIDGKHIVIEAPPNSGSLYFNYKGTFSIVLMAIVDADLCFIAVDIGAYGSSSDGGILRRSSLGQALEARSLGIPKPEPLDGAPQLGPMPFLIVGDEAFPLKDYMMRPYPGRQNPVCKRIFNYRLSRARRTSENAFGLLAQRFRIYQRRLKLNPENVEKIVKATVILHNYITKERVSANDDNPVADNGPGEREQVTQPPTSLQDIPQPHLGIRPTQSAIVIRNKFKDFFSSEEGAVQWQNDAVYA